MSAFDDRQQPFPTHEIDGIEENRITPPPTYFTVIFCGLILWAAIFCAWFLLSGWSSEAEFQQKMETFQERTAR